MKNSIYFLILCACGLLFFSGCSMMPEDEEIIRGSVSESEIFDEELDNENEEGMIESDEGNENVQNENEKNSGDDVDDEEGDSEIQFEIVD